MTRNDFFNLLMDRLQYIPEKKLQKIITYYNDLFDMETEKGKSEEEIINSLGNIELLIDTIKSTSDYSFDSISKSSELPSDISNNQDDYYKDTSLNKEKTDNILSEIPQAYTVDNSDKHIKPLHNNSTNNVFINRILKAGILILFVIIAFPLLSTLAGFVLGLFGASIGLFAGSLGILIGRSFFNLASIPQMPAFITTLPYPALIFLCLGTMSLGIVLFFSLFYITKMVFVLLKHIFIKFLP